MNGCREFLCASLPSSCALVLHLLVPGGVVGSHKLVISLLSTTLCSIHLSQNFRKAISSCCIVSVGTVTFFILATLFGAHPLRFFDTLSWSFLMSSITFVSMVHFIGCQYEFQNWKRIFLECRFLSVQERHAYMVTACTLLGAWVGAFPILLDWNRPWQVWPIPCSVGALIGNLVGCLGTWLYPAVFPLQSKPLLL